MTELIETLYNKLGEEALIFLELPPEENIVYRLLEGKPGEVLGPVGLDYGKVCRVLGLDAKVDQDDYHLRIVTKCLEVECSVEEVDLGLLCYVGEARRRITSKIARLEEVLNKP